VGLISLSVRRWSTSTLTFDAAVEVRAVLPADWYGEVPLASHERALIVRDGRPVAFLHPGTYSYWKVDATVRVEVISVRDPMPSLTSELADVLPRDAYVDTTVRERESGLAYVRGRFERTLDPRRHTFWTHAEARVEVVLVDTRLTQVTLAGQEVITRDKVSLRLSLTVEYAVVDTALSAHAVVSVRDAVCLLVQLASREYVAGVTLDDLLAGRDALTRHLLDDGAPRAAAFGVRIERVGVKDVVLPGEMKALLNKVIEAEKEAAANVILRREETAATRSLANPARVMADNPILLPLRELESLKEIAARVHEERVVVGADGIRSILPTDLLSDPAPRRPGR
jgi:hypothetical protein